MPDEAPLPVELLAVLAPAAPVVVPPLMPELPLPVELLAVPLELPLPMELLPVPLELPVVPDTFDEVRI